MGFTLPGIIELPGSFAGKINSAIPLLGPLPIKRISLAILNSETASCFKAPCVSTIASLDAIASNLFLALINFKSVKSEISFTTFLSKFLGALIDVPTAVPPTANSLKCGMVLVNALIPCSS